MSTFLSRRRLVQATGAALAGAALPALAQTSWPSRPIRIIVPYTAGGFTDQMARLLTVGLQKQFGQPVVIDNKPGANSIIGVDAVAKSAPDGHTFGVVIPAFTANTTLYPKLPYDPIKDFEPITALGREPSLYVVHPDVPVKNLKEFIAYAKKSPGRFSYGSGGNGSAGHLAFEYLKMTADLFLLHVPYRGTGPMMTDLLSGRLEASAVGAAAMLPFIKSGKVRCIATGSAKRLPQLPDVPTVAEQGFPGFEMTQWYGMLAPANMPAANLEKLSVETMKAVKAPASLERLNADAAEAIGGTPAQFAQFIAAEQERWKKVLLRAKVKPD